MQTITLHQLAFTSLLTLVLALANAGCSKKEPPPPPPKPVEKKVEKPVEKELPAGKPTASASSGEGDYKAGLAFDGDPGTRWGSDFSDNQWIIFDLGETKEVAGARIDWETAYGKDYDLLVSMDREKWTQVSSIREGDGGADEIFFKPSKARFIKLQGIRRGTGWGYSIFEFQPLKSDELPVVTATPSDKDQNAQAALDGDLKSAWKSDSKDAKSILIDLRKVRPIGGLELVWEGNPGSYTVSVSKDNQAWDVAGKVGATDGGRDLFFFKPASCRWIKLDIPAGGPTGLAEINLKGGDELSLARQFEALASRLADGALPRWLKRNQTFWTITGVGGDTEETLLGEEGTIEPYKDSFCVMPFLSVDGKLKTSSEYQRSHSLVDGSLPIPTTHLKLGDKELLNITTLSYGQAGSSVTAARYEVKNSGDKPMKARLNLAVWPLQLNPPWQYGGVSPIREISWKDDQTLVLNGRTALRSLTPITSAGAITLQEGDAFSAAASGNMPPNREAKDPDGALSALVAYDLEVPPGGSKSVIVLFPLHAESSVEAEGSDEFFSKLLADQTKSWREKIGSWKITGGPAGLEKVVRSNLAYMLLNRDLSAAQPGPRNYSHAWMRDGSVSTATYLRFAFNDEALGYLEWFTPLVGQDGFAPFLVDAKTGKLLEFCRDWKEYDSQGQYVYAVARYYDFTGDKEFVAKAYPAVQRAMAYMIARLEERRTDKQKGTKFFGILPESNSHEGYFPGVHSYWDDFWGVRGLGDAAHLAEVLGKTEDAQKFREEQKRFREDLHASMKLTMKQGGKPYMPGCAEKCDFDPTSTSIGLTACAELPQFMADPELAKALKVSYDMYVDGLKPRYTPGAVWGSYTPYEARNIEAMVRLGRRDDAARLFEFLTGSSMRPTGWNHLGEVVHYEPSTGSYIGDMPHTWVGADLVNAARSFFVLDDGPVMEIAPGVPVSWIGTKPGDLSVENLPVRSGRITYKLHKSGNDEYTLHVDGTANPPGGFVFHPPFKVKSVKLNGVEAPYEEAAGIKFDAIPIQVTLSTEK